MMNSFEWILYIVHGSICLLNSFGFRTINNLLLLVLLTPYHRIWYDGQHGILYTIRFTHWYCGKMKNKEDSEHRARFLTANNLDYTNSDANEEEEINSDTSEGKDDENDGTSQFVRSRDERDIERERDRIRKDRRRDRGCRSGGVILLVAVIVSIVAFSVWISIQVHLKTWIFWKEGKCL